MHIPTCRPLLAFFTVEVRIRARGTVLLWLNEHVKGIDIPRRTASQIRYPRPQVLHGVLIAAINCFVELEQFLGVETAQI
jgi:hypothetical protein